MTEQDGDKHGAAKPPAKPSAFRGVVRWTVLTITSLLGIVILVVAAFVTFGIPINLSALRGTVETAASEAVGRQVSVVGAITLEPTLWPTVQIAGVSVGNPDGWPRGDFARLDRARAQLGVLPLLKGEIRAGEVSVDGLRVRMEVNAEGEPNWLFEAPEDRPETVKQSEKAAGDGAPGLTFVELETVSFHGISVTYREVGSDDVFHVNFDEVTGGAEHLKPMSLTIKGSAQEIPFEIQLTGGSLDALIGGEQPWPIELVTEMVGARFTLAGEIADPMGRADTTLDFDFQGPMMKDLEALLQTELPPVRSFEFRGRVEQTGDLFRITDLRGEVGQVGFTGRFEADASGARPRLQGALDVQSIDAAPLLAAVDELRSSAPEASAGPSEPSSEPVPDSAEAAETEETGDLDEPVLILDPLGAFDAEFSLTINEVTNSHLGLRDASLKVVVADGGLTAPVAVTLADVPFKGEIRLAPENGTPNVSVSLWAENTDIGELARLLLDVEGVEGRFASAEVAFSARGETVRSLAQTAELRFAMADASLTYGNAEEGGRSVGFTLESGNVVVPAAQRSTLVANGTLLGEPLSIEFTGGTFLDSYIDRKWPMNLTALGGGGRLNIDGTVVEGAEGAGTDLNFQLAGKHIGGLAAWIGVSPKARFRYTLSGAVGIMDTETRVRIEEARIGNTALSGDVGVRAEGGDLVSFFDLKASLIDVQELASLLAESGKDPAPEPVRRHSHMRPKARPDQRDQPGMRPTARPDQLSQPGSQPADDRKLAIDVPIMPRGFEIFDADIDVAIKRIKLDPADVTGATLSTKIRDGHVDKAPFRATVAGAVLAGDVAADLRGDDPAIDLGLRSKNVNVGTLLEQLGVVEGLDLTAGRFDLKLAMRGASTREILERSEFSAGIRDGLWRVRDRNMDGSVDMVISDATIGAKRGRPITLSLDGILDATPVGITVTTDSLASFAKRKDRLRMDLRMAMLGTTLDLTGTAPLPVRAGDLHFKMDLQGKSFTDLDDVLDVSLPPLGPYGLSGDFGSRASGYYVENLQVRVGESTLNGGLTFQTTATPPRLNVDLIAKTIQLDDFDTGDWSPLAGKEAEPAAPSRLRDHKVRVMRAVLSPEVMRRLDARLTLNVQEVFSGRDRLGDGSMIAALEDGRARVDPLTLNIPGGSVDVGFSVEPTATDFALEARAKIEHLDYGILARRIDPKSDVGGIISADVDLKTRGENLDNVMHASNGHIDFAVWPRNLKADLFDLWAVNLFVAMMPSLDNERTSKVNCLVARFSLQDGIMRPSALLIDSTNIQASGDGVIDFKTDTVNFRASPRPKRPQMFSAQTPVLVRGRIPDIKVGLGTGALLGTIVRMVTSPIVVPFQWIFTENEPPDGRVACQRAWGRPPLPQSHGR